jgi:hypothetical protein
VLIRATFGLRHKHSILPQRCGLLFPLANNTFIFAIAFSCFCSRAASLWNAGDLQGVRQSLANQVDFIATFHTSTRRCALTIDLHVPANNRSRREASFLEKSAVEEPAIYA